MFALIATAYAATPVVVEGDPELALREIELRTLVARDNLALVDVSEILAPGPPDSIPCAGPPVSKKELWVQYDAVMDDYDGGKRAAAREKAALWTTNVACLTEVVDAGWLWSAGFVTGQLAWEVGDREGAKRAWTQARSVSPTRPWDDDFTPSDQSMNTFATAFADQTVSFKTLGGPFWVDGQPAKPNIPAGLHVIQTQSPVHTWLVDLRAPILAVHPATLSEHLALDEWSVLLATRLPAEDRAYLFRGDTVVEFDLRSHMWTEYPPLEIEPEPAKWGRWVAAGGATVLAVGLLDVLLVSRPRAVQAVDDGWAGFEVGDTTGIEDAEAMYDAARNRATVDYAMIGAGIGMMVIGAPNLVRTWEPEPTPTP